MDITENNFRILSEYLDNTLSPDPNVRRPGKFNFVGYGGIFCFFSLITLLSLFVCFFPYSREVSGNSGS